MSLQSPSFAGKSSESSDIKEVQVLVIGAGFCGVAAAAALRAYDVNSVVVLEGGKSCGDFWDHGHDKLQMHTPWHGVPFDGGIAFKYPLFKDKQQVIDYLTEYSALYKLDSNIQFNSKVVSVEAINENDKNDAISNDNNAHSWIVKTATGQQYHANYVIVCTGYCAKAYIPTIENIDSFKGDVMHTWGIKNCSHLEGKKVLVVGSGNSAMEILVDAVNSGAKVDLLVNAPRYFLSRKVMEYYYKIVFRALSFLDASSSASTLAATMHAVPSESEKWYEMQREDDKFYQQMSADLSPYGIAKPTPLQPGESASERRAVFDIGAIDFIKSGKVKVLKGEITSFHPSGVTIKEGKESSATKTTADYDCVIFGTGFRHGLESFIKDYEKYCTKDENKGILQTSEYTVPHRSNFKNTQNLPFIDSSSFRSKVNPGIFFVGFDHRRPTVTLGNQGWDAGVAVAKDLKKFNANIIPIGAATGANKINSISSNGSNGGNSSSGIMSIISDVTPLQALGLSAITTTSIALFARKYARK